MEKFLTSVQHKRGKTAALNAKVDLTFKPGELILEDIEDGSGEWIPSSNSKKYLIRIGSNDNFAGSACLWAHAIDVPAWLKTNATPTGLGAQGTITTILDSHSSSISTLTAALGAGGSVSKQINDAIALLDYTSTDSNPLNVVTSVSQTDGKISITKAAISAEMLNGVGYSDLKSSVGLKGDGAAVDTAFGRIAKLTGILTTADTGLVSKVANLESTVNGKAPTTEGGSDGVIGLVEKTTTLRDDLGTKTDVKTTDSAFGRIAQNTEDIAGLKTKVNGHDTDINDSTNGLKTKTTAIRNDLGTKTDAATAGTAFGKIAKNAEDIEDLTETTGKLTSDLAGVKNILSGPAGDTGLVKEVSDLKNSIGNLTNVMNFRGTVTALPASTADYHDGDVIAVTEGDDAGKEFVFDGGKWVEFGNSDATSAAISKLGTDLNDLTDRVDSLEDEVGDKSSAEITKDDDFAAATLYAKTAYTEKKVKTIRSDLGTKTDASSVDSAFGRIKKIEEAIGNPESGKGLTERVVDLETALGTADDDSTDSSAFGKIAKNAEDITAINTRLTKDLGTNTVDGKTAFQQITDATGRIKANEDSIKGLNTTVGDSNSGLVSDVNKLKTDLGDAEGQSTSGDDAFSKIRKNISDITANGNHIKAIMDQLNKGWFTKDDNNNLVWYAGLETSNPTAISIDCGEIV